MGKKRVAIEAAKRMKELMAEHFMGLDEASRDPERKVAWCTSVGPAELLRAMDFEVYFPENHAAILGATRTANDVIPKAVQAGYSPEICSYLTSDVGAFIAGATPLSKLYGIESVPRPDVLVYNTNQCRDVQQWFSWYAGHFNAPLLGIQTPDLVRDLKEEHIHYVAGQMRRMAGDLALVTGKKLDIDRFRETVLLSSKATLKWQDVLECARNKPSPLTFFDGSIHMGPIVVLRGTEEAVDYYELLYEEMEQRIASVTAAVEDETFRLYWEGMPIWGKLRDMDRLFRDNKACVVASTYCNSWVFPDFDPEEPFLSTARAYTRLFIARSDDEKEKILIKLLDDFAVDGIIYHDAKTCPNNSNTLYGLPQRMGKRSGVPYIIIQGDLNDLRCYSEEQTKTLIEAFIEKLQSTR